MFIFSNQLFSLVHCMGVFLVSANPKLTIFDNFGFLYDSINLRNIFRLKKQHTHKRKSSSYGKLLSENNVAINYSH